MASHGNQRNLLDEMEKVEASEREATTHEDADGGDENDYDGREISDEEDDPGVFGIGGDEDEDGDDYDEDDEDDHSVDVEERDENDVRHVVAEKPLPGEFRQNRRASMTPTLRPLYEESDDVEGAAMSTVPTVGNSGRSLGSDSSNTTPPRRMSIMRDSLGSDRSVASGRTSLRGSMSLQMLKNSSFNRSARSVTGAISSVSSTLRSSTVSTISRFSRRASDCEDSLAESERCNDMAVAASIVAATQNPSVRRGIQFGQGEYALVQLHVLRLTESEELKDLVTLDPVNKFGYPSGEGKTERQKHGPYKYVLCTIVQVHFDEIERYYTVRRLDTEQEQRADPGYDWMEPIRNYDDIEVAYKAAKRNRKSIDENEGKEKEKATLYGRLMAGPKKYYETVLSPMYRSARSRSKSFVTHLLHGDHNFACSIHFTGINFLVLCSFVFLFLEVVLLAFLPAKFDHAAYILGFVVWLVLVLELFFEYVIRPSNYGELITSDKAFSPDTARHINAYHLVFETLALILFIPQIPCAFDEDQCGIRQEMGPITSALDAVSNSNNLKAAGSRFYLGLTYLRTFGLVRHWKQMWINHTFEADRDERQNSFFRRAFLVEQSNPTKSIQGFIKRRIKKKQKVEDDTDAALDESVSNDVVAEKSSDHDQQLKNAANIGTALMLINSHRVLFFLLLIAAVFPVIYTADSRNPVAENVFLLLQANNVFSNTTEECDYLKSSVISWLLTVTNVQVDFRTPKEFTAEQEAHMWENETLFLQWAQLLPVRCPWQRQDGVITDCVEQNLFSEVFPPCQIWNRTNPDYPENATTDYFAKLLGLRAGGLAVFQDSTMELASFNNVSGEEEFFVKAIFNENEKIELVNLSLLLLMLSMLALGLIGLTVMRGDAGRLVLGPLQQMLKIVVRYAENPLSTPTVKSQKRGDETGDQLGYFETEQLLNAIAKIADLLRKCWGVAGAGIISSNLARTKSGKTVVFNPTIPGKRVYALFGFVGICDFDKQLRALDGAVMDLINDVARVVHDEVYRWALGDSGQCNKNLGGAFLMVFRIGDFTEVHDRKKRATDVVFSTRMKKPARMRQRSNANPAKRQRESSRHFDVTSDGTLQLASLPGIQAFTDRALLGFLKSFAGLHRDQKMQDWQKDFRLSAGVGTFTINVIYGMDAGWAVEGAVGSEYKIDATYLSPHVNMASRMMSACKQYGVKLLMSQAVEELLSKPARAVMRHLDTVYVKGSNVSQRIYSYDARFTGVDFFLFERSQEQANVEAEAYSPNIWTTDRDLRSMRQHVSDEFHELFKKGVEQYIEGQWKDAIQTLRDADYMMLKDVVEEGYVNDYGEIDDTILLNMSKTNPEIERIRNEYGDGACKCLVGYMQRRKGVPPPDWHGVRKLMSK